MRTKIAAGRGLAWFLVWFLAGALTVGAQKGPENTLTQLPQDHEYQRVLRAHLATLTEKDFDHGVQAKLPLDAPPPAGDADYAYRQYLLTLMQQPLVGSKRGTPAVNAPPGLFVLSAFETAKGVMQLPVWPETLISFVQWDYPGNLYRHSRALKLRAYVAAATWLVLFHQFAEQNDGKVPPPIRPDWHGYNPVFFAAPYPGFKDVLPPPVQRAYETGLKLVGERILAWGVRGESCENDLMAPLGLVYISRAIGDAAFTKAVEERTRLICSDPQYCHPAGYWVERGGPDFGFGGAANLYAVWVALLTDWPFARDAVARSYRLRGHLILPEPDGWRVGPSHFCARLSSPVASDQFACDGARDFAATMVTDEAAQFVSLPAAAELAGAAGKRAHMYNEQLGENPRVVENGVARYIRNDEIANAYPWKLRMWMTYNFPISLNPGYECYRPGAYAHRQALERAKSPLLQSPFLRGENFVREFTGAFVVARQPGYAAILHTGPIGDQRPDDNKAQFKGPLGLSGGQLSAFWTPTAGAIILGQRAGMSYDKSFDVLDAWRTWPNHAVSGVTAGGVFFTSARIVQPTVTTEVKGPRATVQVGGTIPAAIVGQAATLAGKYDYTRTFQLDEGGVHVATTVSGAGPDVIAELYEVLPVNLRDVEKQPKATPTTIEFRVGGQWAPATDQFAAQVQAVRLTRFTGAVLVTFDQPQRVKLAPAEWADTWFTKATARNVLIDLRAGAPPAPLTAVARVAYRLAPAAP